jgi:hypothetical protein
MRTAHDADVGDAASRGTMIEKSVQSGAVRHRAASSPVASARSRSATSSPGSPYGCHASTEPSGRAIADVVGAPSLAQFTDATKIVFSAARHRTACS